MSIANALTRALAAYYYDYRMGNHEIAKANWHAALDTIQERARQEGVDFTRALQYALDHPRAA